MKPNELKLWHLNIRLAVVSNKRKSIDEVIQLIYLAGRKAQVKVDLGIANSFNHGDHNGENFQKCCATDVAKAIEGQELL